MYSRSKQNRFVNLLLHESHSILTDYLRRLFIIPLQFYMKPVKGPEEFYGHLLELLLSHNIPFMIGGTYAFVAYIGIARPTKDMDIFCKVDDYPEMLRLAAKEGYETEIQDELWLAKIHKGDYTVDLVFAEKNGLEKVDDNWYKRARQGEVFGHQVKLMPIEEMIRSKAYIQNRERYDGADVIHLLLQYGKTMDWHLLQDKMEPNWEVLFAHLINFSFVYPNEIHLIPEWLIAEYSKRLQEKFNKPVEQNDRVTRGLLISWNYRIAVEKWGYRPISPFFTGDHKTK